MLADKTTKNSICDMPVFIDRTQLESIRQISGSTEKISATVSLNNEENIESLVTNRNSGFILAYMFLFFGKVSHKKL